MMVESVTRNYNNFSFIVVYSTMFLRIKFV